MAGKGDGKGKKSEGGNLKGEALALEVVELLIKKTNVYSEFRVHNTASDGSGAEVTKEIITPGVDEFGNPVVKRERVS